MILHRFQEPEVISAFGLTHKLTVNDDAHDNPKLVVEVNAFEILEKPKSAAFPIRPGLKETPLLFESASEVTLSFKLSIAKYALRLVCKVPEVFTRNVPPDPANTVLPTSIP